MCLLKVIKYPASCISVCQNDLEMINFTDGGDQENTGYSLEQSPQSNLIIKYHTIAAAG